MKTEELYTMKYKRIDVTNSTRKVTIQLWRINNSYGTGVTIYKRLQNSAFLLKYFEKIRGDRLISFPYYYIGEEVWSMHYVILQINILLK